MPGLHLVARALCGAGAPALDDVLWFTSGRPVEDRVLAEVPSELCWERVKLGLEPKRGGAPSKLRLLTRTPSSVVAARRALKRHRSQALLGLGGFTTLPAALAARSLGLPIALLEINAAPGQATRVLSHLSRRVFHAWSATLPGGHESTRHRSCGAPVAPEVVAARLDDPQKATARAALGFDPERPLLLVLGGSQGAGSLNRFVREHAGRWIAAGSQVLHQCGPGRTDELEVALEGLRVEPYIAPIAPALAAASVVLCRGGASTLAEVAAACVPAWVVPYPDHSDMHQERNARELERGVRIVADEALDGELALELENSLGPQGAATRDRMRQALAAHSSHDAALKILVELEALVNPR